MGARAVEVDPQAGELLAGALLHMPGYQRGNAAVALAAAQQLAGPIALEDARAALQGLQIPGRFETLRREPLLLIDAAHNPQSAQVLAAEVERRFPRREERPTLLIGVLADKDVAGVVGALAPLFERIVCTASRSPRSVPATELASLVAQANPAAELRVIPCIADALAALAKEDVVASGSITVAGEVKGCFLGL